jgi:hypothetical protein
MVPEFIEGMSQRRVELVEMPKCEEFAEFENCRIVEYKIWANLYIEVNYKMNHAYCKNRTKCVLQNVCYSIKYK